MNFLRSFFTRTPRRTHYRSNGPVVINPDVREFIDVRH